MVDFHIACKFLSQLLKFERLKNFISDNDEKHDIMNTHDGRPRVL